MLGGQQLIADVVAPPSLLRGRPETLPANNIGDRCAIVVKLLIYTALHV